MFTPRQQLPRVGQTHNEISSVFILRAVTHPITHPILSKTLAGAGGKKVVLVPNYFVEEWDEFLPTKTCKEERDDKEREDKELCVKFKTFRERKKTYPWNLQGRIITLKLCLSGFAHTESNRGWERLTCVSCGFKDALPTAEFFTENNDDFYRIRNHEEDGIIIAAKFNQNEYLIAWEENFPYLLVHSPTCKFNQINN